MVSTTPERARRWRARAGQLLALLAVMAAGYVSLGTSCAAVETSVTAQREVAFLEGEQTHLVRLRLTPPAWHRLTLSSSPPVGLAVDYASQDGGPITVDGGSGGTTLWLECTEFEGCRDDFTILVDRAGQSGPFTSVLTANLVQTGSCSGEVPPAVEVRLDVEG
jgi:hypothetical protein